MAAEDLKDKNAPKATSTTKKKTTTKKSSSSSGTKKSSTKKPRAKAVKTDKGSTKQSAGASTKKKTTRKPRTKKPKSQGRIKDQKELSTLETLEAEIEGKPVREKKLGKTFYLIFSIVFYAIAFFYVNNVVYDGGDYLQSAIFAFAALFIAFVLMLFNIHMLVFLFFVLPFKRLFKQAKQEAKKEIIYSVGKNQVQTTFNKYKSIFTLVLYALFGGLIAYAAVMDGVTSDETVLEIIYGALISLLIYLVVICSWQYLFNIIPSILEKSIDAKNGYVLTLSAAVIAIYIIFITFEITYLAEIMIFVLIIGFVALLGVNLNMIVGEINIFQNLRGRKSKAVTRVVFVIFFGFHIYVILYASVVAYSIYNWEPDSFNFAETHYDIEVDTELYSNTTLIEQVYDSGGEPIDVLYDMAGNEVSAGFDEDGNTIDLYDEQGGIVWDFYDATGANLFNITDGDGNFVNNPVFYEGRLARIESITPRPNTYGDFLYWTVISVSTIGYGDIAPSTEYPIAQAWGGFLGIYGLTFFALSISFVSNIAMEGVNTVRQENRKDD